MRKTGDTYLLVFVLWLEDLKPSWTGYSYLGATDWTPMFIQEFVHGAHSLVEWVGHIDRSDLGVLSPVPLCSRWSWQTRKQLDMIQCYLIWRARRLWRMTSQACHRQDIERVEIRKCHWRRWWMSSGKRRRTYENTWTSYSLGEDRLSRKLRFHWLK